MGNPSGVMDAWTAPVVLVGRSLFGWMGEGAPVVLITGLATGSATGRATGFGDGSTPSCDTFAPASPMALAKALSAAVLIGSSGS